MFDTHTSLRAKALALHRNGMLDEAKAIYHGLLDAYPTDGDVLGLLGVLHDQKGEIDDAQRLLELSLADRSDISVLYRNLNNLLGLLIETGSDEDGRAWARRVDLPDWPATLTPDPTQRDTFLSLIEAFKTLGEAEKALRITEGATPFFKGNLNFAIQRAELLHQAGRLAEARAELAQDFGNDEENPNLHALRAATAFEASDFQAGVASTARFAETMPTLLAAARPSQKFVLAVFNPAPEMIRDFRTSETSHYAGNFPSQLATEFADQYRFLSIFPDSPTAGDALRGLPRPALALNNFTNAEKLLVEGKFAEVCAAIDSLGVPVLNHPRLVAQVTRQKNSERLARVEGIIAPKIVRYQSTKSLRGLLITDIEARYDYPMILRTVFHQMGKGTWLIQNREELHQALDETDDQQFYLINYVDLRHDNGYYRRIRAAFVDKTWTIIRVDYHDYWNVRGRRELGLVDFYREHPGMMDLADRITLEPFSMLSSDALDKLDDIARVIPLDIFGMDFDITDDGQIAVFEANATMNLLSNAEGGLSYPQEAQRRLTQSLHALFERTAVSPM